MSKWKRRGKIFAGTFIGQATAQLLNQLVGFILLRVLSVLQYAQFTLSFGFQSTFVLLTDLGVSSTLTGLVGRDYHDPHVIGKYVHAIRRLRTIMFLVGTPILIALFPLMTARLNWNASTRTSLLLAIIASIWLSSVASTYGTTLFICGELKAYYKGQLLYGCIRLILTILAYKAKLLNAPVAAWINTFGLLVNASVNYSHAKKFIIFPPKTVPEARRAVLKISIPLLPSVVYFAIQGQITVFLISLFGHNSGIAQVGALSRLGQLFLIATQLNGVLLEPFFARQHAGTFLGKYLKVLGVTGAICTLIAVATYFFPQPLGWLLGSNYSSLHTEIYYSVLSSCIYYFSGVLWTINSSRKWIFWYGTISSVVLTFIVQLSFMIFFDLSTTLHVIYLSCWCSLVNLVVQVGVGIYGFKFFDFAQVNDSSC